MADNVVITPGTGATIAADELTDATLGTVKVQYTKLMDGTLDGTNKAIVSSAGALKVDGSAVTQPVSGTVGVNSLPTLPSGSNTIGGVQLVDSAGTNKASISGSGALSVQEVAGGNPGNAVPLKAIQIAGSDGTSLRAVATDTVGNVGVNIKNSVSQGSSASVANAWPIKVSDGFNTVSVASLSNAKALDVAIVDGSGNQVTSFGVSTDTVVSGTIASQGGGFGTGVLNAVGSATIQIGSGTFAGLQFYVTGGGDLANEILPVYDGSGKKVSSSSGYVSVADNTAGSYHVNVAGCRSITVGSATLTSGSVPMAIRVSTAPALVTSSARMLDGSGQSLASSTSAPVGTEQALIVRNIPSGTQPVSGTVAVSNFPATQPVSGTVGVSSLPTLPGGSNTIGGVQLVDSAGTNKASVSASGALSIINTDDTVSGTITTQNLNPTSGTATANSTVSSSTLNDNATVAIQVTGTYTGALTPQVSVDGSNWVAPDSGALFNINTTATSGTIASAATGIWQASVSGFAFFRLTALAAMTGTATVTLRFSGRDAGTGVVTAQPSSVVSYALSVKTASAMNTATNVKASSGNLYGFSIVNSSTSAGFIQFFNTSTTTTTSPVLIWPIAASGTVSVPPGTIALCNFSTGISINCATGVGGIVEISVSGSILYS